MAKKANSKSEGYSPVKTGGDPRSDAKTTDWLKIAANTVEDVTILVEADEIISCEQCAIWLTEGNSPVWVFLGPEDPSNDINAEKRYRAYLPVLHNGEVKVWSMGKGAHGNILDIADTAGSIKGLNIRIKRTGSGLGTRYGIINHGTRTKVAGIEEVDVISMLGPLDLEGVQAMIAQRLNCDDYEEVLLKYRGKKPTVAQINKDAKRTEAPSKGRHVKPKDEDEIEDLDDLDLDEDEE